jgi:hypothetical protein
MVRRRDEELTVSLVASIYSDDKYGGSIGSEESTNGVEFLGKDFEDDKGEGKLT